MPAIIVGYMFLFIFRPFEVWPLLADLHIERIYMLFALTVFVFTQKNRGVTGSLHYYILALCVLIVLAPFYSPYPLVTEGQADEYLKYMVFYVMLLFGIRSREELEKVLLGFLAVMLIYEGKSLWEFLVNGRHMYRMGIVRLIGIDEAFSDPNTFSASIAYALPIAFMFLRYRAPLYPRWWILWGVGILLVVSVTCFVFTGSRSGQLTLLFLLLMEWFREKRKILMAVAFAGVLAVVWNYMPMAYQNRFESIWNPTVTDPTAQESAEGRVEGIKDGYALLQLRPLFGFGAGSFGEARGLVGKLEGLAAHNLYGQVMGDLGLVGTFLFVMICITLVKQSLKLRRENIPPPGEPPNFNSLLAVAILQTMILLLFDGNFGHNLYRHTWLWISAFIMLAMHFHRQSQLEAVNGATEREELRMAQ